jgi:SAM-dependent methyltransferase
MTTSGVGVAPGNEAQAQAWDGDEGELWARHADFFEESTRPHQALLMAAAAIGAGERVLDVGCGSGGSTIEAARAASEGSAVGIDLSSAMVRTARDRAAARGVGNARFVQGDAQVFGFEPASFDVAISRTGTMFFADPVAAFGNLARAIRPDGRVALVSWRAPDHNEWFGSFVDAMTLGRPPAPPPRDAPGPFAHADPVRNEQVLTAAGLTDVTHEPLDLPMHFGATAADAFEVLRRLLAWMVADLGADERSEAFADLRRSLEEHQTPAGVSYGSAAWLITARRP